MFIVCQVADAIEKSIRSQYQAGPARRDAQPSCDPTDHVILPRLLPNCLRGDGEGCCPLGSRPQGNKKTKRLCGNVGLSRAQIRALQNRLHQFNSGRGLHPNPLYHFTKTYSRSVRRGSSATGLLPFRFLMASCSAASTVAAASACMPGMTCEYRSSVMLTLLCPSRSLAIFGWTPLASMWVACAWRRSWNLRRAREVLAISRPHCCEM
jgi:hypothetical protein